MRTGFWVENVRQALDTLASNRLRAALTLLGILIGVAAVIAMVAIGRGVQYYINAQFAAIGTNLIFVIPRAATEADPAGAALRDISSLTMRDVRAIERAVQGRATAVVPVVQRFGPLESEGREAVTVILGTTPGYAPARNWRPLYGSFLEEGHILNRSRVIVLGLTPARRLFPDVANPIGRTVRINGVPFRVIGVMSDKGGSAFGDYNDLAFIPLTVAQEMLYDARDPRTGEPLVTGIMLQAARAEYTDAIVRAITETLREQHRIRFQDEDDFAVLTQFELVSIFGQISSVLTVFLGALGAISLLVGGIGIMNIMLVSVTERTREIGLRKAVGARRRDIMIQFLTEAVLITLMGGAMGTAAGMALASLIGPLSQGEVQAVVGMDTVILAVGVSAAVGLFFGLYPAWRAARLDPIVALRYE
ncbi:ABC transporter permease [Thermoflexus sp.]|uniref:ABC transporter permease n=3 Tax=Thermoflexus sp. TaxID=1969742 RepID=UPI0025ECA99D|nr:ABC transporter permease [Thermoflexus sp.]MCS6962438.1 ABC transporter permease [Thermoflexus sp.]MCX7691458.1 ABC transporter permease [Thermoflexus sp.]MDW8184967.1 ABC transporter permease [Anaerolineae bacterium]